MAQGKAKPKERQTKTAESQDPQSWMGPTVLIAKNALVWLYQLAKIYNRPIAHLDEVPMQELEKLASSGFNALWLIGLWRRSAASKRIKQLAGNAEAEASAYSLDDYEIDEKLGGWPAFHRLQACAWQQGIRLACDMVPNHTSLDSALLARRPELFMQSAKPPFPCYRFTGPNLSDKKEMAVYLEDGYKDRSDAAVVFKRVDAVSGDVRYIYHGNDGTSVPWNDTAQINFFNAKARQAVIASMAQAAKAFPIVRFDAAMVLVKSEAQRLWYPLHKSRQCVPGRQAFALTQAACDALMPREFWLEAVEALQKQSPGCMLMAEAFWMLERYFVRQLGLHRVYNSAFMKLLAQKNFSQYRRFIKESLAFDVNELGRFVNFMSNPDEEPAIAQFGKGPRSMAIAVLLVALPGLPMFAHGQVEGFKEKYGMEYAKAYLPEKPSRVSVEGYRQQIFPLLRLRRLFCHSKNFRLFDFLDEQGKTIQSVFAFCNEADGARSLVLVNCGARRAVGAIFACAPYREKPEGALVSQTLAEIWRLRGGADDFLLMQELRSGALFAAPSQITVQKGLQRALEPYEALVFWRIREEEDQQGLYKSAQAGRPYGGFADFVSSVPAERPFALRQALFSLADSRFGAASSLLEAFYGQRAPLPAAEAFAAAAAAAARSVCGSPPAKAALRQIFSRAQRYARFAEVLHKKPAGRGFLALLAERPRLVSLLLAYTVYSAAQQVCQPCGEAVKLLAQGLLDGSLQLLMGQASRYGAAFLRALQQSLAAPLAPAPALLKELFSKPAAACACALQQTRFDEQALRDVLNITALAFIYESGSAAAPLNGAQSRFVAQLNRTGQRALQLAKGQSKLFWAALA